MVHFQNFQTHNPPPFQTQTVIFVPSLNWLGAVSVYHQGSNDFFQPSGETSGSLKRTWGLLFSHQHGREHDAMPKHLARGWAAVAAGPGSLFVQPGSGLWAVPSSQGGTARPQQRQQPGQHQASPQQIQRRASHRHQREAKEQWVTDFDLILSDWGGEGASEALAQLLNQLNCCPFVLSFMRR